MLLDGNYDVGESQRWTGGGANVRGISRTITHLRLTDAERARFRDGYGHLNFPAGAVAEHEPFVQHSLRRFLETAPARIVDAIRRWHADRSGSGVLMIDNWGVDEPLPPTPTDGRRTLDKLTSYSEQILTAVGSLFGQVFAFAHERNGDLIQDLTPVRGKESALTNEGSQRLGWHPEHAATGYALGPNVNVCDYLVFFGLRADPRGAARTLVADIRDALELLDPGVVEVLRSPVFVARPPLQIRAGLPENQREFRHVPVLAGPVHCPDVRLALYGDMSEGETDAAREALAALSAALDAVQRGVPTVPGRLVVVDNARVLHGRWPFTPAFDGRDRWLQRAMVTASLRPLQRWQRQSLRVLTPAS